ncbi:platelet-derived growth factor C isoform X2 [Physeter macrocephalus]|uniref:Platelet-derived growth factor C isoform X2 n=1 Tax=Physeter macrocephalus TaxID=9755 RepID=A0A2Y9SUM0_PHYMC|nr:platelet-derived growth factor C isoform X2 [Physeter catodon]|eukprot:XP_023982371.1 platelet-derived growth factor C isoform X2 [Physeter catodon]
MGGCGKEPAGLGGAEPGPQPRRPSARRPRARPLSPMLLFGLLLLTSALAGQRPGTRAESSLSSKLQLASTKEQNGVQDPQHERIITVSTNGSIHSPRFPHTYPRNMVLVWRLVAVEENVWIQLTFDERFGLEDPEDDICKYDFVEVEEPSDGAVLGRWCGSGTVPGKQISKGNQIRIRFVSDEYFPSEPGFCIHYSIVMPQFTETVSPSVLPAAALPLDLLNNAVTAFSTLEDLIRYLEPERWQLDLEDLSRPTWQLLGKAFVFGRKSRGPSVETQDGRPGAAEVAHGRGPGASRGVRLRVQGEPRGITHRGGSGLPLRQNSCLISIHNPGWLLVPGPFHLQDLQRVLREETPRRIRGCATALWRRGPTTGEKSLPGRG